MSDALSPIFAIALGLGLAAAAGFRVFVPLFAAGLAARTGHLELASDFAWLSSAPALIALGTATAIEVVAYYVPWLDHALDTVATPSAVVAGIVASASVVTDVPPMVKWLVAVIGGGGMAGLIQGATVVARLKSATLTGGLANPVVATGEALGAGITTVLAILLPLATLLILVAVCTFMIKASGRLFFGRRRPPRPPASPQGG